MWPYVDHASPLMIMDITSLTPIEAGDMNMVSSPLLHDLYVRFATNLDTLRWTATSFNHNLQRDSHPNMQALMASPQPTADQHWYPDSGASHQITYPAIGDL
jgi:hypothetical protein